MLLSCRWPQLAPDLPPQLLSRAMAISGLFDLEPIRLCYLNAVLGLDAETARRNSPIHLSPQVACPLVLAVGERESETYHAQSADMAAAWNAQGADVTTLTVPAERCVMFRLFCYKIIYIQNGLKFWGKNDWA